MAMSPPLVGNLGDSVNVVNRGYPEWKTQYDVTSMVEAVLTGRCLLRPVKQFPAAAGKMPA